MLKVKNTAILITLFLYAGARLLCADTVQLGNGQVLITPPEGWQLEPRENLFGIETHAITLIADSSRKPGCTIAVYTGDRQPAHTEASFLTYVNNNYAQTGSQFIEKTPSFINLNIQNGIAYYFAANYAEYYGQPPAEGRAKVVGILFLYRENNPLVAASLYVDDPEDPALALMIKAVTEMEMVFPGYPSKIVQFSNNNSIKIEIPSGWGFERSRGTPIPGMETFDLEIMPPHDKKALLIITVGRPRNGNQITREQFDSFINGRIEILLPYAVEKEAEYKELQIRGGYSKYCILTDKSLVNKRQPEPDEYKYITAYLANYNNGCLLYVTALTDDPQSESFQLMLDTLSSIEP